jgi:hypothetical protein
MQLSDKMNDGTYVQKAENNYSIRYMVCTIPSVSDTYNKNYSYLLRFSHYTCFNCICSPSSETQINYCQNIQNDHFVKM